jgi:hypothetical protein
MEKNIVISGIKVNGNGSKGLDVTFTQVDYDGISYNNSYVLKSPKPVSSDFKVCLAALKPHVLKFFRMEENVQDLDLQILEITIEGNGFYVKAKVATAVSSAHMNTLKSCKIMESNFSDFDLMVEDVTLLRKEVNKYVLGKSKEDSRQFLIDYAAKSKKGEMAEMVESLEHMTEEEAHQKMIQILSDNGAIFLEEGGVGKA